MPQKFAHSDQLGKSDVRYLRCAPEAHVRYDWGMKLRIRELRKAKGWTVEELAEKVGLSKSYVSEIETGKKQANQVRMQKFADILGVKVVGLLDPDSIGHEEHELLTDFADMTPSQRQSLLSVARSMKG